MKNDQLITYAHKDDPKGVRFRQYAKYSIPAWAVDIQQETSFDDTIANNLEIIVKNNTTGSQYEPIINADQIALASYNYGIQMVIDMLENMNTNARIGYILEQVHTLQLSKL